MDDNGSVRCDACGCAFAPAVFFEMEREIQRFIMTCPYCGRKYLVAVTDKELRAQIRTYSQMAAEYQGNLMRLEEHLVMQQMKKECINRCEELKRLYPLEEGKDEQEEKEDS